MVQPNIIFIVMDTCRADVFYKLLDADLLPGVKRILSDSKVYRNARSVAPWTVPSHGSMFSGLYPTDHGTSADDPRFEPPTTPLAERLRLNGYQTVCLSANPWITPNFNFTNGFDQFKTESEVFWGGEDLSGIGKLDSHKEQVTELFNRTSPTAAPKTFVNALFSRFLAHRKDDGAKRITNDAIKWISRRTSDCPFFLFCNYTEPHLEYDPPTKFIREELPDGVNVETARSVNQDQWAYIVGNVEMSEQDFEILRALYRAEVRYLDSQLARLFEKLAVDELLNDTAVILVSDHGENIGEHGLMDHQYCLYETLLQVPLVIRYPSMFEAGTTDALVETHRLYETVTDMAGINESKPMTAPSFVGSGESTEYAIAEYIAPQPSVETLDNEYGPVSDDVWRYDRALRAIQDGRWKFIEASDGTGNVYHLHNDFEELRPVENDDIQKHLQGVLTDKQGPISEPSHKNTEIPGESRQRLRDLGYL